MSVRTMARVWDSSTHSGSELLMLLAIADFSDDAGRAYPSISTLAFKCRTTPRYAMVLLNALSESGELEIRKNQGPMGRGGKTNLYRVALERLNTVRTQAVHPGAPLEEPEVVNPGSVVHQGAGVNHSAGSSAPGCREVVHQGSPKPPRNHQEPPRTSFDPEKLEHGAREQRKPTALKTLGNGFAEFWEAWPRSTRKGGKAECEKLWIKEGLEATSKTIVVHVKAMAETEGWTKQRGEFVPAPIVYLRGKRWDGAELGQAASGIDAVFDGAR